MDRNPLATGERLGWGKPDDLVLKGGRRWLEEKNLKTSG